MQTSETIVYGGAFNPPTKAHQAIVEACAERAFASDGEVWIVPSGSRADKQIDVDISDRLQMCYALARSVNHSDRVRVNDTELLRDAPTETIDTMREFIDQHPDRSFHWVFGADSLEHIAEWRGGEWMLEYVSILAVPRVGSLALKLGERIQLLDVIPPVTSSTEVREKLRERRDVRNFVPAQVLQCITERAITFS